MVKNNTSLNDTLFYITAVKDCVFGIVTTYMTSFNIPSTKRHYTLNRCKIHSSQLIKFKSRARLQCSILDLLLDQQRK